MTEDRTLPNCLSPIQEIIAEAREGKMFILVDDEGRENEGDLVIPAQMATPSAINFMAKFGRGLICLALESRRVEQLGLGLMSKLNGTRHETAFTVSIEAREGVSTGISAPDRALTVAVAIDASKTSADIVSPGHVFPLAARKGGVLVRAGHTEAAVDVARLAGLNPSGVICEIMRDDGSMARLPDLTVFAATHGLKIGSIGDLIAYRLRHDHNLERAAEAVITSRWGGNWNTIAFRNKALDTEVLALVKGEISSPEPVLVRMHALDVFRDTLREVGDLEDGQLGSSMQIIDAAGRGVIVLLLRTNRLSDALRSRNGRITPSESEELRDYGVGAQILAELGINKMILITNSHQVPVALKGYGLDIVGEHPLTLPEDRA